MLPWLLRAAWAVLPVTLGPTLADRMNHWDHATRTAGSVLLWAGWAAVAVATAVALPVALVVVRLGAAAAVVVAAAATAPAVIVTLIAASAAARPEIAEWYVNGPAYPNERRYPLKVPGALLLGPLWLAALLVVGAPCAAVLLLAGRHWVTGAIVAAPGGGAAFVAARALFGLTRRWLVFVPAGVVLHDPLSLTDPVLFERGVIETMRAAPSDTDSLDLTQGALGLAVELVLTEKVPMVLTKGRRGAESGASARLLFTPTRPGRVLSDAAERRIAVG
jgi:hypothetical protein